MINFRFHLVSLVAVFLALGLGVAMGASFIDRATVETLRGRLDQLESNYRERGEEIDSLRNRIDELERDAAALLDDDSALLADRLADVTTVLITMDDAPGQGVEAVRSTLQTAGSVDGGRVVVDLERLGSDPEALAQLRDVVGLGVAAPARVRERVLTSLGEALGVLAVEEPTIAVTSPAPGVGPADLDPSDAGGAGTGTPTPGAPVPGTEAPAEPAEPAATTEPTPTAEPAEVPNPEWVEAEALILELLSIGVVRFEPSDATTDALFGGGPVRYVLLVDRDAPAVGDDVGGVPPGLRDLAVSLAGRAPAVLTVAEPVALEDRDPEEGDGIGQLVRELRDDEDVAGLLSTVDHLDEVLGRIALVLALDEQSIGAVGHYGSGAGAASLLPRVPD